MAGITEWQGKNANKSTEGAKNGLKREKPTIRQGPVHEDSKSYATRGQEWATECTDRPLGHGKRMSNRQAFDTHGSGAHIWLRHHQPVPNQYKSCRSWVRGKREYGLVVGGKGSLFWGSR